MQKYVTGKVAEGVNVYLVVDVDTEIRRLGIESVAKIAPLAERNENLLADLDALKKGNQALRDRFDLACQQIDAIKEANRKFNIYTGPTEIEKLTASVESLLAVINMDDGDGERERCIFDAALKYDMDQEFAGDIPVCVKHATRLYDTVHGAATDTEAECLCVPGLSCSVCRDMDESDQA